MERVRRWLPLIGLILFGLVPLWVTGTHLYGIHEELQEEPSPLDAALMERVWRDTPSAIRPFLILLTDLAHNLLAWTMHWMFLTGPFAHFGPLRLTQDVLALPGRLRFEQDRLVEVHLNKRHPYAAEVAEALHRLLSHFAWP